MYSAPETTYGRIYGLEWQYDKARGTYRLMWGGIYKDFKSIDEMHTFILTTDCRRFKINIYANALECGDTVDIETEIGSGRAEVVLNNIKRGLILFSIEGVTYGAAYNDINEVKIVKKNTEDLAL